MDPCDQKATVGSVDKEGTVLIDRDACEFRDVTDDCRMQWVMCVFVFFSEIPEGNVRQDDYFCVCVVLCCQLLKLFDSFVEVTGDPFSLLALFD